MCWDMTISGTLTFCFLGCLGVASFLNWAEKKVKIHNPLKGLHHLTKDTIFCTATTGMKVHLSVNRRRWRRRQTHRRRDTVDSITGLAAQGGDDLLSISKATETHRADENRGVSSPPLHLFNSISMSLYNIFKWRTDVRGAAAARASSWWQANGTSKVSADFHFISHVQHWKGQNTATRPPTKTFFAQNSPWNRILFSTIRRHHPRKYEKSPFRGGS